jgi:hypothetical protein
MVLLVITEIKSKMNDVIFFLPYDVDRETISALNKEAKSRGLQISAKFR